MKIKYELNKCEHVFRCPPGCWHNGMVCEDENLDPEILATFDNKEEALTELKKYTCSARYMGSIGRETRAVEYWVEVVVYDEDGDFIECPECYFGEYPYWKVYDKEKTRRGKYDGAGFIEVVEAGTGIEARYDDENWLDLKVGSGKHTLSIVNMDNEEIATYEVGTDSEE